jgi:hypothetical protein
VGVSITEPLGFGHRYPVGFLSLLVGRRHIVIILGYCQLEAGLDAVGAVNALKRVIVYLLTLRIHGESIRGADSGAIPAKVTFGGIKV